MVRTPTIDENGLKKGEWSAEEDDKLRDYVVNNGPCNWRQLPKFAGLARCGKSCRLRWNNYLKPGITRGNFTKEEDLTILRLHKELGNKWSTMAANLPGRTDNEIKNHWHTHLKKKERKNLVKSAKTEQTTSGPSQSEASEQNEWSPNALFGALNEETITSFTMSPEQSFSFCRYPSTESAIFDLKKQLSSSQLAFESFLLPPPQQPLGEISSFSWTTIDDINSLSSSIYEAKINKELLGPQQSPLSISSFDHDFESLPLLSEAFLKEIWDENFTEDKYTDQDSHSSLLLDNSCIDDDIRLFHQLMEELLEI